MAEKATLERIAVGDHVRLKTFMANQHQSYQVDDAQFASRRDAVNGLVLSIRDITTGSLVASTEQDYEGYVIELIFDNTFSPRFASLRNAPRGTDRITATPGWRRIRAALRDLAAKSELISSSAPGFQSESPLAKMLDGWKVVKVRSEELENLEKPESEPEAATTE